MNINFYLKRLPATILLSFTLCSTIYIGTQTYTYQPKPKTEVLFTQAQIDSTYNAWQIEWDKQAAAEHVYNEVDKHIKNVAPKSKVSGKAIVENCIKYDVDIRLVLAQAEAESHFGTQGVARKTNSIFNVNAWDGRSADDMNQKGHGFKHPDQSISPFLQLLKNDYLINGKTEQSLLKNYVNRNGKRYASAQDYESKLKRIYKRIPKELYQSFKDYKEKM